MSETAQDHKFDLTNKGAQHHVDRMLDKAVEDSFPASDPVALSMPHNRVESRLQAVRDKIEMPSMSTMLIAGGVLATILAVLALRK